MRKRKYRKIPVNDPCICCDTTESDLFLRTRFTQYPGSFDYRKCRQCNLVFNSPRLADLSTLYDKDYFFFHTNEASMRNRVFLQIQRLVLQVECCVHGSRHARLIELGSARGHLLYSLRQIGYSVQGLEISVDAVAASRAAYEVPVFNGTAEEYLATGHPGAFDVALACTVIEHVGAPNEFVEACGSLLKPDGILVMDMPNIDSVNAEAAGPAWDLFQKYHIYLFSPTTITLLLERHQFEVIRTFTYDNSPFGRKRIRSLRRMRWLLLVLDRLGLYSVVRSWYRERRRRVSNVPGKFSIAKDEIRRLEPYEDSRDARGPLARQQRGNHLVVVARKVRD